ncbi:MAG: hypothetical protein ABEJ70_08640 [Halobacteriaceae archaeon]
MTSRWHPVVALLAVALLAGCVVPSGTDRTTTTAAPTSVALSAQNGASEVYAVRFTVVDRVTGFEVTDANGTARTYGPTLPPNATRDAVDVRVLGDDPVTREYTLAPGSGVGTTLDATRNATVAYVVRRPNAADPLRSWGLTRCPSADRTEVSLRLAPDGHLGVATTCADATTAGRDAVRAVTPTPRATPR